MSNRSAAAITKEIFQAAPPQPTPVISPTVRQEPVFAQIMKVGMSKPAEKMQIASQQQPMEQKQTNKQTNNLTNKQSNKQTMLIEVLQEKATEMTAFRISPSVLGKVDESQYLLKKRHGIKVSNYEIFAIALENTFWEIENLGVDSDLVKALIKHKK